MEQQAVEEARIVDEARAAEEARLTEEARIVEEEWLRVEAERKRKEVEEERQAAIVLAKYQWKEAEKRAEERIVAEKAEFHK